MADNVTLDEGSGGPSVATDDVGGVQYQRVKVTYGTDGAATDVSDSNPLPVDDAGGSLTVDGPLTDDELRASAVEVDGSGVTQPVSASSLPLPTGAATAALQTTLNGLVDGVETLLGTIDADTSALAGAVDGSEVQVDVAGALPAGDNNIGNVDIASALPAGTNNIGDVDVASIAAGTNTIGNVGLFPRASGGLSVFRSVDLDESEEDVKTSAGQVYGWALYNDGAAEVYVHIYNATAANVTVGTTTPLITFPLPAGSAANVPWPQGIEFDTAISIAATTAVGGTGAPAANQVIANILYL